MEISCRTADHFVLSLRSIGVSFYGGRCSERSNAKVGSRECELLARSKQRARLCKRLYTSYFVLFDEDFTFYPLFISELAEAKISLATCKAKVRTL